MRQHIKLTILLLFCFAPVAAHAATTWNPADKGANVTLSSGNLDALDTGGGWNTVRSTISESSGLYCFESKIVQNNGGGTGGWGIGIANASQATNNYLGSTANSIGYYPSNGQVYLNGGVLTTIMGIGAGNFVEACVDYTNKAIWFRQAPGGYWNNSVSADPASNTGGISITSVIAGPVAWYPAWDGGQNKGEALANFGVSPLEGSLPSGFSTFDADAQTLAFSKSNGYAIFGPPLAVTVSKSNGYAIFGPPPTVNVSKSDGYAIFGPPPAVTVSKSNGYAVLGPPPDVTVSKAVVYAILVTPIPSVSIIQ